MNNIKLSIVIPFYNSDVCKLISTIKSLVSLNIDKVEIIVINDGSDAFYITELNKEIKNLKNVFVFSQKNEGVSSARNNGINKSRGEWITFLDSDDALYDENILQILNNLDENIDMYLFQYSNKRIVKKTDTSRLYLTSDHIEYMKKKILGYNVSLINSEFDHVSIGSCWGKIYKKDFLEKKDIQFNEKLVMGEDLLFMIEILSMKPETVLVTQLLYIYNIENEESICSKYNSNIFKIYNDTLNYANILLQKKLISISDMYIISNTFLLTGLNIFIFHKNCPIKKYKSLKKEVKKILRNEYFNESIKNVNYKYLRLSQSIILNSLRLKLFYLVIVIKKIQQRSK